jgi:cytochrome b pre-mRNA-processing protein 3
MFALFKSSSARQAAELAYARVVEYARQAAFFGAGGVPDTVDGRFELICLHAFLYLRRLKREDAAAQLSQVFFDTMFADFDRSLREMGTGDLGVGRQIRRMVEAFYGRIAAYEAGLAGEDATLQDAVGRNVFGTAATANASSIAAIAAYLRREDARLDREEPRRLLAGDISFGEPVRPEPAAAVA